MHTYISIHIYIHACIHTYIHTYIQVKLCDFGLARLKRSAFVETVSNTAGTLRVDGCQHA